MMFPGISLRKKQEENCSVLFFFLILLETMLRLSDGGLTVCDLWLGLIWP